MALDFDRLARLMMMTTSANDYEARLALKKANDLLKKENKTWVQILQPTPSPFSSPPPAQGSSSFSPRRFDFEKLFRTMVKDFGEGFGQGIRPKKRRRRSG